MDKDISIWGIETNNLKDIRISLKQNSINLILGPSGSGKSSLAYNTIAQIGQHEFLSMFADNMADITYRVKGYRNMLAAIPIRQSNFNNNIRSTIGTYFGLNRNIILLYAVLLNLEEELFVLNREENLCDHCHGLGVIKELDPNKIINYDIPISQNPFRCWNRYKDFYKQILTAFCIDSNIDSSKNFHQLTTTEKELLLYGNSCKKYSISYKKTNRLAKRTTQYYGVLTAKPMLVPYNISTQFYSDMICQACHGQRYSPSHNAYKLQGLSIGEFMTTPFKDLSTFIDKLSPIIDQGLIFVLEEIHKFINRAIDLNLGHLSFHRSIPSLSGGELQRLRLIQVLNTQLSNLLIVLDEPLAGLSGDEKDAVFNTIKMLSHSHTLVVVDHSDVFTKISKKIIVLGEKGGKDGGALINVKNYLDLQKKQYQIRVSPAKRFNHITIRSSIYSYNGIDITLGEQCLNLITGRSGIGKSTLLREYLPQYYNRYLYINQKPLMGNKNSSVVTALGIFKYITTLFANKYHKDTVFFSNQTGSSGACKMCKGAGYLEYETGNNDILHLSCKTCNGTGFNKLLQNYTLEQKNMFNIWNMTIDEGILYFSTFNEKITNILKSASNLMLGHLKLGQPVSTLSGGENLRVKLLKDIKPSITILGVDEPFKGLDNLEIYQVVKFLDELRNMGKTIIVADHSDMIEHYFSEHIELVDRNSILTSLIKKSSNSNVI